MWKWFWYKCKIQADFFFRIDLLGTYEITLSEMLPGHIVD